MSLYLTILLKKQKTKLISLDSPLIKEIKALLKSDAAFKELLTFLVKHIRSYEEALITLKEGEIKHE